MTKEERLSILNESIYVCKAKGIVRNQNEFARMIGVVPTTISSAKGGKEDYLTDQLIFRIRDFLRRSGVTLPSEDKTTPTAISVPVETIDLYTSMAASIERLTKETERLNSVIENLSKDGKNVKRA